MLLTLVICGYGCGQRSSRQVQRLGHTDIAFGVICAGDVPDHPVLARLGKLRAEAFAGLVPPGPAVVPGRRGWSRWAPS